MQSVSKALKFLRLVRRWILVKFLQIRLGVRAVSNDLQIGGYISVSVTDDGLISIDQKCSIEKNVTIKVKFGQLLIGEGTHIGTGSVLVARESIKIGRNNLIAEYVTIRDQDHAIDGSIPFSKAGYATAPIIIGDNVWLGAKVTVTRGVTIGKNVVVGANSVVTGDLPDNCVAVGAPARVVRKLRVGEQTSRVSE